MRGEECRPRTVLSWLLAKWVVGESEEAGRRTLSSHGPENPDRSGERKLLSLEKVGTAGPWTSGGTETEDSPPGPPPGEGASLFSPSPEKEQIPTSSGCPRQGCFVDFLDDLGPGWDVGGTALLREVRRAGQGIDLAARAAVSLQALDGRRGRFLEVAAFRGHRCTAIALSTWGMPAYPPPLRVVRMEEADEGLLAVKWAIHDFVSSSCTSGKKGIGAGRGCEPRPAPRNQSSSREGSGLGGLLTSSPMLTATRASMAVTSGSGAAVATTPEGGSPTAPSSSEDVRPSPDAAINILSTDGAPNEMLGAP